MSNTTGPIVSILSRLWDAGIPRLRRWREQRKTENRIAVFVSNGSVRVEAPDKGEVMCNLQIVNFTAKEVSLDHVEVDHWRMGSSPLSTQSSFIKASGAALPLKSGHGYFCINLQSSDIRAVVAGIGPSPNNKCSPQAYFGMSGVAVVNHGVRMHRVPLIFEGQLGSLYISSSVVD